MPCGACKEESKARVDCINPAGHNDAKGTCVDMCLEVSSAKHVHVPCASVEPFGKHRPWLVGLQVFKHKLQPANLQPQPPTV